MDADGKAVNEVRDEFVLKDGNSQTRWFPMTITKSQLLAYVNLLLPNDSLSLKCEFGISSGTVSEQNVFTSWCEDFGKPFIKHSDDVSMIYNDKIYPAFVPELQTHLKSMLEEGTLHDVSLQIGPEVIPAHKNILSARSPVFRAMFTKDMAEAISNTVVIEDLSVETVLKLLLYVYTDTIQDYPWETMKELYSAADKYEVLSLKKKCVSFFKAKLSISNVCDGLILADLHQDEDLETAAVDYISECDTAFYVSKEWKELEKNNLPFAFKVMRKICCNKRIRLN
ncbi:unnamed protein product [Larinioides sclopetarius]|uniref:BTB domain-containing protein n=1 Tax=Larinioides sclopetarius TaxID=280406 RepID=A0AAV2BF73_9ARAC